MKTKSIQEQIRVTINGQKKLPHIPKEYILILMFISLVCLRVAGIDTFVTAGVSTLIGYQTGKHIERKTEE